MNEQDSSDPIDGQEPTRRAPGRCHEIQVDGHPVRLYTSNDKPLSPESLAAIAELARAARRRFAP